MGQKSSTFIKETRERETWLPAALDRDGAGAAANGRETDHLLSTAALLRGAVEAIPVPDEAEESSCARAVAYMQDLREQRLVENQTQAPWYLRLGHAMRVVFTFGKRR
jgi:hypothetical protein